MENTVIQFSFPSEAPCDHEKPSHMVGEVGGWGRNLGPGPPGIKRHSSICIHRLLVPMSFVTDSDVWPKHYPFCVPILHRVKISSLHITCLPLRRATGNIWDHFTRTQCQKMERIMPQTVRHLIHQCLFALSSTLCTALCVSLKN